MTENSHIKLELWGTNFATMEKCEKAADKLVEKGYRKQEWISVEDRLPEGNERVLVYLDSKRSYTRIDTDRHYNDVWVRWGRNVTHWMPLPEPPKMKGGAE